METVAIDQIVDKANRSELHRQTGISLSGVSRILSGGRTPRTDNLEVIARQLGVPMDVLHSYLKSKREARQSRRRNRKRTH